MCGSLGVREYGSSAANPHGRAYTHAPIPPYKCLYLFLFLLLTGCARERVPDMQRGKYGGTLRFAVTSDIQSLDPAIGYDTNSWPLVRMLYHGLLDYGDGPGLVPWMAEKMPTISPDGRTYTFQLRKGVRFSNGRELVAQDFVYSLERILDPRTKSPGEGFFRNIAAAREFQKARDKESSEPDGRRKHGTTRWIEPTHVAGLTTVGRYGLRIQLEQPDLAFMNVLAMPFSFAVPQEEVERFGEDFFRHPVGTGPFVLKEWVRDMKLRFERNPRYYLKGQPYLDAVEVMVGGDDLIHTMMFERGELDLLNDIPSPDFIRVTRHPIWKRCVATMPLNATTYLALNCEMKPFTDVRVRRAMNYAVDKERLLKLINGTGAEAKGVLPPLMPGYNPDLKGYPYNPAMAKRLLTEAGYPNGFKATLWASVSHGERVKMAEALKEQLAEVGVRIDIKAVAFSVWDEATGRRHNTTFVFSGWYQDYPDPSNFLDVLLNGDRIVGVHCNNCAFYSNPRVNALLRLAAKDTNAQHRLQLYRQAEEIIVQDAPWVPLYHPYLYILYQPWVKGHKLHPVWPNRYERFWIERRGSA